MSRFLLRRLLGAIPLLFGVALISFILMQAAPGGPDATYARSPRMTEERLQAIRARLGIDQPIPIQFAKWIRNLLSGDLGLSYVQNRPVTEVIWNAFPNTVLLVAVGLMLALVFALFFGLVAVTGSAFVTGKGSPAETGSRRRVRIGISEPADQSRMNDTARAAEASMLATVSLAGDLSSS